MSRDECVQFLQLCLPRLRYRWRGFRKVRAQVCKRIRRRMAELELSSFEAYRERLELHADEWRILDSFCYVSISRFYRDRTVFDALRREVLPELARRRRHLEAWCAGCCSGEEPYTLRLVWDLDPDVRSRETQTLGILATEREESLLERARRAVYPAGSLADLPAAWRERAFAPEGGGFRLAGAHRRNVRFLRQDLRHEAPAGPFDLVLCRNLAFTYFDEPTQKTVLQRLTASMKPGSILLVGCHETIPGSEDGVLAPGACPGLYHME